MSESFKLMFLYNLNQYLRKGERKNIRSLLLDVDQGQIVRQVTTLAELLMKVNFIDVKLGLVFINQVWRAREANS